MRSALLSVVVGSLVACGGSGRPDGPRATGTLILDAPLEPGTEAEVLRSRTLRARVAEAPALAGVDVEALARGLRVTVRPDTRIVAVEVVAADPALATRACDVWLRSYVDHRAATLAMAGGAQAQALADALDQLPADADPAERARLTDRLAELELAQRVHALDVRVLDACAITGAAARPRSPAR